MCMNADGKAAVDLHLMHDDCLVRHSREETFMFYTSTISYILRSCIELSNKDAMVKIDTVWRR